MKKERAGTLKKQFSNDMTYFSFYPSKSPPNPPIEVDSDIIKKLIKAHKVLSILDDRATRISTLEDIFNHNNDENINADVDDVINYIKATKYAIKRLETLPLYNRLLLETHKVLLSGVRGKEKNSGEFRLSQIWIDGAGSTIKTARYIPPPRCFINERVFV